MDWCALWSVRFTIPWTGMTSGISLQDVSLATVRKHNLLVCWRRDAELMLDCYMAFDVEYTVRLAERLRPYRLRWIEEYLIPEDIEGHHAVRRRLPWMTLAGGSG